MARRRDGLLGLQGLLYDALDINNYCSWSAMTTVHVSVLGLHKHTVHTQSYAHTHNWDTAVSATTRKPTAHNPATITTSLLVHRLVMLTLRMLHQLAAKY